MGSLLNSVMLSRLLYQLLLVHLMVINLCFSLHAQPLCIDQERSSLLQFKESLRKIDSGDPAKLESWTEASNCCLWAGVQCHPGTGHVIGLDLSSSSLYGSLNSSSTLFSLVHLERLNLADNDFNYSSIPTAFGKLSRLNYLNLSFSRFSGQIPNEISGLSRLTTLDLSLNIDVLSERKLLQLKNPDFKSLIMKLTSLEDLSLSLVDISSTVPDSLAAFSSLKSLLLRDCGLTGEFPMRIFQLPNLQILSLRFNKDLYGVLPPFQQRSPLTILRLARTSFSGKLPSSIEKLDSLNVLDLKGCNFSGEVPFSIGKLNQLNLLDLSENNFSGQIPSSLENLADLTDLLLSSNQFTGPIPESFSKLTSLQTLFLQNNELRGTVNFDMFLGLQNLKLLSLSDNNLSVVTKQSRVNSTLPQFILLGLNSCNLSKFPDFLRYQENLAQLSLRGNQIGGLIPKWVWNVSQQTLKVVNFANNYLTGFEQSPYVLPWENLLSLVLSFNLLKWPLPIPPTSTFLFDISNNNLTGEFPFCNLLFLQFLHLSNNRLSGELPQCLGNFDNQLLVLNLRNNSFSGSIPDTFTGESQLRMMDLSYNQLQGPVPRSLANCRMLEKLVLSNNQLNGIFPSWLGSLPELRLLVLKSNEFHGVIEDPQSNSQFPKLRIIDISNNNFVGKLPSKYIQSWNAMKDSTTLNLSAYLQTSPTFNAQKYLLETNYALTITPGNNVLFISYVETNYALIISVGIDGAFISDGVLQEEVAVIDLSSNKFGGEIPQVIGDLKGLNGLNLSNNILSGGISSAFGNLTELEFLDLSHNKLSGEIPKQLTNLTFLQVFNVSHNLLTGPIPQGNRFDTFESSSYEGNLGLCGHPLPVKCGNSEASTSESEFEFDWIVVGIGYGCGLVIGLFIGQIAISKKHIWSAMSFRVYNNARRRKGWMRLSK